MPAKTYKTNTDSEGHVVFTTYKVWFASLSIRSRTFDTLHEAEIAFDGYDAERLDKIVTTILRTKRKI